MLPGRFVLPLIGAVVLIVSGCNGGGAPEPEPRVAPSQQQLDLDLLDLGKPVRRDGTIHI